MSKATMSSVCLDTLNKGGVYTLAQLHKACVKAGLDVLEAQVYASLQVMASTKKIKRGTEKRTYMPLVDVVPMSKKLNSAKEVKAPAKIKGNEKALEYIAPMPKTRTKVSKKFNPDQVIAELTELLGPPKHTSLVGSPFVIMLDDNDNADYCIKKWKEVMGSLSGWLWYKVGEGYMVGGIK